MDKLKLQRINELANKKKEVGLSPEELSEQALLRQEYLAFIRGTIEQTLDNVSFKESDGTITPVKKKC